MSLELQGGAPEQRQVPPIDMLLDGLEMAEAVELQAMVELEIGSHTGSLLERPTPVFGEGVTPTSTPPPERVYPRITKAIERPIEARPRRQDTAGGYRLDEDGERTADRAGRERAHLKEQAKIRQSINAAYADQEAARKAEEIPADEAMRLAKAETEEFEAIENPAPPKRWSILDSSLFSAQSVREYLDRKRPRAA